jgi:hypothetical protein
MIGLKSSRSRQTRSVMSQKFETTDWEVEAKRVVQAFGVKRRCAFKKMGESRLAGMYLRDKPLPFPDEPETTKLRLIVEYNRTERRFTVWGHAGPKEFMKVSRRTQIVLDWDGAVISSWLVYHDAGLPDDSELLARGLFFLDLLTPEVEATLKVNVSQHQKMEWALVGN